MSQGQKIRVALGKAVGPRRKLGRIVPLPPPRRHPPHLRIRRPRDVAKPEVVEVEGDAVRRVDAAAKEGEEERPRVAKEMVKRRKLARNRVRHPVPEVRRPDPALLPGRTLVPPHPNLIEKRARVGRRKSPRRKLPRHQRRRRTAKRRRQEARKTRRPKHHRRKLHRKKLHRKNRPWKEKEEGFQSPKTKIKMRRVEVA